MGSTLLKRRAEVQDTEDMVLDYLKTRLGQPITTASASKYLGITQDRFRRGVRALMAWGAIERSGSTEGGWCFVLSERSSAQAGRVNCVRCGTVGCTKHSAARLSAGYSGQAFGGW